MYNWLTQILLTLYISLCNSGAVSEYLGTILNHFCVFENVGFRISFLDEMNCVRVSEAQVSLVRLLYWNSDYLGTMLNHFCVGFQIGFLEMN